MKKGLIIILFLLPSLGNSQATNGMSGLIHIPTARMFNDGDLIIGASYIPKGFHPRTYGRERGSSINPGLNTYISYGILPFVEIMFRYSHELNMRVNPITQYFPDRMLGLRVRILNERKQIPALVIGLQDISALIGNTCLRCTNYSALYSVLSKNFHTSFGELEFTAGSTFDLFDLKSKDLNGPFFGMSYSPFYFEDSELMFEYDSKYINLGFRYEIFNRVTLMYGLRDLRKSTFSLSTKIILGN